MIYKGKCLCGYYPHCEYGDRCDQALTEEAQAEASLQYMDIAVYTEKPDCWQPNKVDFNKYFKNPLRSGK